MQMTTKKQKTAYIDEKFECIRAAILNRRWTLTEDKSQCELLFTNLRNINFSIESARIINHLKGSNHLSNKAFLAYHMHTSGYCASSLPTQWSPAYEDTVRLVEKLLLNAVYCFASQRSRNTTTATTTCCKESLSNGESAVLADLYRIMRFQSTTYWDLDHKRFLDNVLQPSSSAKDVESLEILKRKEPWRVSWGGTSDLWIIKPVGLSCGENIEVKRGMLDTLNAVKKMDYKCVVQKYIERPLLVRGGRKFDIRQWVLVSQLEPHVVIHGFEECYLRISGEPYSVDKTDLDKAVIHLTNHAIQQLNLQQSPKKANTNTSSVVGSEVDEKAAAVATPGLTIASITSIHPPSPPTTTTTTTTTTTATTTATETSKDCICCNTMMSQSQFNEELYLMYTNGCFSAEVTAAIAHVLTEFSPAIFSSPSSSSSSSSAPLLFEHMLLPQIKHLCCETILAVRDKLERVGEGFEWLGFDIMITESLQVLLIEVNVSPDISPSTSITAPLVEKAAVALFDLLLPVPVPDTDTDHRETVRTAWHLWHDKPSPGNSLQYARSKRDKAIMNKDYGSGRSTSVVDNVIAHLKRHQIDEKSTGGTCEGSLRNADGTIAASTMTAVEEVDHDDDEI